jgi:hypothetical protein
MPVTSTIIKESFLGNGDASTPYTFTFTYDDGNDIKVLIDGVATTAFTHSGNDIRTDVAVPNTSTVTIYRETPKIQTQPFPSNTTPAAEDVRAGFDKLTLIAQEQQEQLDRSVKSSIDTPFVNSSTLGLDSTGNFVSRTAAEESTHLGIGASVAAAQVFAHTAEEQAGFAHDERVLAEAAATAATAAQSLSSATLLDLSTRSFPKVRIAAEVLGTISSDVTLTFPGGGSITFKASARPYTEPNSINAEGTPLAVNYLGDIVDAVNGNAIDFDSGVKHGLDPILTVSNYTPIPDWTAEFPVINGVLNTTHVDLTYYGAEDVTFTVPSPFVVIDGADLKPPANLPFSRGNTFAAPTFTSDPSDNANRVATTAVLQTMLDAGKSIRIPDGVYRLNPLTIKYKGTVIQGESIGGVWLDFSNIPADGRAFTLYEDPGDLTNRMPGGANTSNNYGTLADVFVTGPGKATTSVGFWTMPASESPTDPTTGWQGDAITFRNCWFQNFGIGMHWNNPNKYFLENCLFKSCTTGLRMDRAGTATNNTLLLHHVHVTACDTGIHGIGADAMITLGDASAVGILILQAGGRLQITSGQLEGCQTVLDMTDATASISHSSLLSTKDHIPIVARDKSVVKVEDLKVIFSGVAPIDTPLVHLVDSNCSAWGAASYSQLKFSDYRGNDYQVLLWDGSRTMLNAFPVKASGSNAPSLDEDSRGLIWQTIDGPSDQGDDIKTLINSGITTLESNDPYVQMSLTRPNHLTVTRTGTGNNPQTINGVERYVLQGGSLIKALTVRLPRSDVAGVALNNTHVVTIVDTDRNASANNITFESHPSDPASPPIVGSDTLNVNGGCATFLCDGVKWYRL